MITTGLMSSLTDQWATPQALFDELDKEFGFTLDACASDWNHKVANYYDEAQDALVQSWTGVVWMNPPYGRTIKAWMQKAYESWLGGGATVVCLVPARTDTAWWHDYAAKGEVRFIRGRIKFVDQTGNATNSAPFPSAIVVYR
jgi:phage N-6-adenine-methyltransferase